MMEYIITLTDNYTNHLRKVKMHDMLPGLRGVFNEPQNIFWQYKWKSVIIDAFFHELDEKWFD